MTMLEERKHHGLSVEPGPALYSAVYSGIKIAASSWWVKNGSGQGARRCCVVDWEFNGSILAVLLFSVYPTSSLITP